MEAKTGDRHEEKERKAGVITDQADKGPIQ
jgi:hypothetical protein